jgi:hypothetical protein
MAQELHVVRDQSKVEQEWLYAPDIVVGMYSTVLVKARFYGKPAISFQPDLAPGKEDLLFTNSVGITTLCTNQLAFWDAINFAMRGHLPQKPMPYVENSVDRILSLLIAES